MNGARPVTGTTYYVSTTGDDRAPGTSDAPLLTINAAAQLAQPGDVVQVRSGIYREEVVFPRGGTSDAARITYAAEPRASVTITGSDLFSGWTQVSADVWELKVSNAAFSLGAFNPYAEQVRGDWFDSWGRTHRLGMVYLHNSWLPEAISLEAVSSDSIASWWSVVDMPTYDGNRLTTITARFPGVDPNQGAVEVGVRGTVFKPEAANIDYITIRGFNLRNAATNWAAPTMGQLGLVSAYWCKGWVIEDNEIAYSRCSGIALGKYFDLHDGLRGSTEGYYLTVADAQDSGGWSFDNVGSHVVRGNTIHHCGQTGIVGSLGAIGSTITGNEIYQINNQGIWDGLEMAGIKLHGAINVEISGNHIYDTGNWAGIWLDWMAQGTTVVGNLMHDNVTDIFAEVDHGPLLLANNVLLSGAGLACWSDGVAAVHNLVTGTVTRHLEDDRQTPSMKPHSTETDAIVPIPIGGHQWMNNILGSAVDLTLWDSAKDAFPLAMRANVRTHGTVLSNREERSVDATAVAYSATLTRRADGWYLAIPRDAAWRSEQELVSTDTLAKAPTPNQPFTNPDGSAMSVSTDYFGEARDAITPFPGPFETAGGGAAVRVWSQTVPATDA